MGEEETSLASIENFAHGFCYECEYETLWTYYHETSYTKIFGVKIIGGNEFIRGRFECKSCGQEHEVEESLYDEAISLKKSWKDYTKERIDYLELHDEIQALTDEAVEVSTIRRSEIGYWLRYDTEVNDELQEHYDGIDRSEDHLPRYQ